PRACGHGLRKIQQRRNADSTSYKDRRLIRARKLETVPQRSKNLYRIPEIQFCQPACADTHNTMDNVQLNRVGQIAHPRQRKWPPKHRLRLAQLVIAQSQRAIAIPVGLRIIRVKLVRRATEYLNELPGRRLWEFINEKNQLEMIAAERDVGVNGRAELPPRRIAHWRIDSTRTVRQKKTSGGVAP